jgi:hypothetical protein
MAGMLSPGRRGTTLVIVLLMWGERIRYAVGGGFRLWLSRELGRWWSVGVMLALVAELLRESPILNAASRLVGRQPVPAQ